MLKRSYQAVRAESVAELTPVQFLHGSWSVHRRITDRRAGTEGEFRGEAVFEPAGEPGVLTYAERGELTFGAHRGPAYRNLVFRENGHALDVSFSDGRPFYVLVLRGGDWGAEHLCGADLYTVTGRITGPDAYTEHWHAGGPSKDYDLETSYYRRPTDLSMR